MKRNIWLVLAVLVPMHAHGAAFSPVQIITPRMFPVLPTPIVSIRPTISLPSPMNPMAPLSPSALIAPSLSAALLPSVSISPLITIRLAETPKEENKVVIPGSFNPGSPIKMPLKSEKNISKAAIRLGEIFDGTSQPAKAPVVVPTQQIREDGSASGQHLTLPEMDLENEIGIGQIFE